MRILIQAGHKACLDICQSVVNNLGKKLTSATLSEREGLYEEIKSMNRRGHV